MSDYNPSRKKLAFVILIGGRSARFGSDKGIFEFLGKPLISYQLDVLSKFNNDIFLIAHSQQQIQSYIEKIDIKKIMAFIIDDVEFIDDKELYTPMLGLYSAFKELNKLHYEKAFVLSCDMPLIKYKVIDLLIKESEGYNCCIPEWDNGFKEPLFAIYPVEKGYKMAKDLLEKKLFKLTKLLNIGWNIKFLSIEEKIQELDDNHLTFININGPIDIEKLMKLFKKQ